MYKPKVLLLDDQTIITMELQSTIKLLGKYNIIGKVKSHEQAIEKIKEEKPDIFFVDIHLGDNQPTGIQTAKEAKELYNDIKIVFLTSYTDDNTMDDALDLEPVTYLAKPFKREDIKSALFQATKKIQKEKNENIINLQGGYSYNFEGKYLNYQDKIITLSKKEKQLMDLLSNARGEIITSESLEHEIYKDETKSNSSFRTLLYRFRKKLDSDIIETIPGVGLKLLLK